MTTERVPETQPEDLKQRVLAAAARFREACESDSEETKQREKRLQPLLDALTHGIFRIVVMGEVKKGKTSFINALLAVGDLLPIATDVATSIVFKVLYGPVPKFTVFFLRDESGASRPAIEIPREQLAEFGTESGNPGNAKGVEFVAIELPSPFLRDGVVLIDTPGVGGLFRKHRDISFGYAPNANAVFFVLDSVEAVISKDEVSFLRELAKITNQIVFLQTKTDAAGEEQSQAWRRRNLEVLAEALGVPPNQIPYFLISSKLKKLADAERSTEYLNESGFHPVIQFLKQVLIARRDAILACQFARALATELAAEGQLVAERLAIVQESSGPKLEEYKTKLQQAQKEFQDWLHMTWPKRQHAYQHEVKHIERETRNAIEDELSPEGGLLQTTIDDLRARYTDAKQLTAASEAILSEHAAHCNRRANALLDRYVVRVQHEFQKLAKTSADDLSQIATPRLAVGAGALRRDNTDQFDPVAKAISNFNIFGSAGTKAAAILGGAAGVAVWFGIISNPIGWTIGAVAGLSALATSIWTAVRGYQTTRERQLDAAILRLEQAMRTVSSRASRGASRLLSELAAEMDARAHAATADMQTTISTQHTGLLKELQEAQGRTAAETSATLAKLKTRFEKLAALAETLKPIVSEPSAAAGQA